MIPPVMSRTRFAALTLICALAALQHAATAENLLLEPNQLTHWQVEQHEGAHVTADLDDGGIRLNCVKAGTDAWHMQLYQNQLPIVANSTYVLKGEIRADSATAVYPYLGLASAPYSAVTKSGSIAITKKWTPFSVTLVTAATLDGSARGPMLAFGQITGSVWLRNVSLEGPSAAQATTAIPDGWFAWPAGDGDIAAGSALDTSDLGHAPAGKFGRVIVKDGHFAFTTTGERVRFFASNLGAEDCFVDADTAERLAVRLRRSGVNLVRLHHLDNEWMVPKGGSMWDSTRTDRQTIDPKQLDRFDGVVAALIRNGIYLNINLKVSKQLSPADGFPDSLNDFTTSFQKRVDMFNPRMIELQEVYAKQLLTHVNSYTKRSLINEPAVASIEINNENSLLGFWTPNIGGDLEQWPEPFRGNLTSAWTAWLKKTYTTDAAIRAAWNADVQPLGDDILSAGSWSPEQHGEAKIALTSSADGRGFTADISTITDTSWHIQTHRTSLTLREGEWHTLSFEAKADHKRSVTVTVGKQEPDWHNMGLDKWITLDETWQSYRLPFKAKATEPNLARIAFHVGQDVGIVEIRNLHLHTGTDAAGLPPANSLATGIPIPTTFTPAQHSDWIHFLTDTELAYADRMRTYLRKDLGATAPITCSQIDYGGVTSLHREQGSDFIDAHGYWEHPHFTQGDWDRRFWEFANTPQLRALADKKDGLLGALAKTRVQGKPFTVSEYDHPAPGDFVCEMMPSFIIAAARQDWDALYTFSLAGERRDGSINGFFDQQHHPAKWGFYPSTARIWREGRIAPAAATVTVTPPILAWTSGTLFSDLWAGAPRVEQTVFSHQFAVAKAQAGTKPTFTADNAEPHNPVTISASKHGSVLTMATDTCAAIVGQVGDDRATAGALTISCAPFGLQFLSCTATSLKADTFAKTKRVLITTCSRAENQDIVWNADRTSVGDQWGRGPVIVERIPAVYSLQAPQLTTVYALTPDGSRAGIVPSQRQGGTITWKAADGADTIHYEIVATP